MPTIIFCAAVAMTRRQWLNEKLVKFFEGGSGLRGCEDAEAMGFALCRRWPAARNSLRFPAGGMTLLLVGCPR